VSGEIIAPGNYVMERHGRLIYITTALLRAARRTC
jgi:hypothetical protein